MQGWPRLGGKPEAQRKGERGGDRWGLPVLRGWEQLGQGGEEEGLLSRGGMGAEWGGGVEKSPGEVRGPKVLCIQHGKLPSSVSPRRALGKHLLLSNGRRQWNKQC